MLIARQTVLSAFLLCLVIVASRESARAVSEACPATLYAPHTVQSGSAASAKYDYSLSAFSERSIDAVMVADTNKGWFAWSVSDVPLMRSVYLIKERGFQYRYRRAESGDLSVLFPADVVITHAWVARAKTTGETILGWDARGMVDCEVPDLTNQGAIPISEIVSETKPVPSKVPQPEPIAYSIAPPFPATNCKTPFALATVPGVVQPKFPDSLVGIVVQPAVVVVVVAIDASGNLVDSWILAGSGYPAMDAEATNAVKLSRYEPSTAYCHHIPGTYTIIEEYTPS